VGPFAFTGLSTTGYPDYRDTATSRMLVADPGGSYGIEAIDLRLAVPPPDGRWSTAEPLSEDSGAPPGITSPPPVPPVPPVPLVEGSETA
jgi:hypothetical protein